MSQKLSFLEKDKAKINKKYIERKLKSSSIHTAAQTKNPLENDCICDQKDKIEAYKKIKFGPCG